MTFEWLQHGFWLILTVAVLVWYGTVTVYVAVRGALDVKGMLAQLKKKHTERTSDHAKETL